MVEHDLGADILQLGAAAGERAGEVIDHADLELFLLGLGGRRHSQHRHCGKQPKKQACSLVPRHPNLPGIVHCVLGFLGLYHIDSGNRCQAHCTASAGRRRHPFGCNCCVQSQASGWQFRFEESRDKARHCAGKIGPRAHEMDGGQFRRGLPRQIGLDPCTQRLARHIDIENAASSRSRRRCRCRSSAVRRGNPQA